MSYPYTTIAYSQSAFCLSHLLKSIPHIAIAIFSLFNSLIPTWINISGRIIHTISVAVIIQPIARSLNKFTSVIFLCPVCGVSHGTQRNIRILFNFTIVCFSQTNNEFKEGRFSSTILSLFNYCNYYIPTLYFTLIL